MDQQELVETINLERVTSIRKRRVTQAEVKDFVKWAYDFDEHIYDKYTAGKIKQLYKEKTGKDISDVCIRNQRERWVIVDGNICKKTQ